VAKVEKTEKRGRGGNGEEPGREVTLVVITGHSGAGKSEAIAAFEDGGYFCVDNLPPRMIGSLGELFFRHDGGSGGSSAPRSSPTCAAATTSTTWSRCWTTSRPTG
jgi:Predicted P-loop-containing kinase